MQHGIQDYVPLVLFGLMLAGLTALITARVSTRWLGLVMLLWLGLPVILMVAILTIGSALAPAQGSTASNAIFAGMIVGMFAFIPWAIVCLIGFAIGIMIRRRRGAHAPETAPEPATPQRYLAADAPKPHFSHASPDGSLRIDIEPVELAREQWVNTPRIVEAANGRILLDLLGSDWQADTAFPRARSIWLGLRRFHSPGHLFAELDLDADRYRIALASLDTPDEEGPLGDISGRLAHWWTRASALAVKAGAPADGVARPRPFAAWRSALAILIGALIAIALLTYLSEKYGVDPPSIPILRPGAGLSR